MAGTDNQGRVSAIRRLRERTHSTDAVIDEWIHATGEVETLDTEIEQLHTTYQTRLVALQIKRSDALTRSHKLLGAVADAVGDDITAEMFDLPLRQVRDARRSSTRATPVGRSIAPPAVTA